MLEISPLSLKQCWLGFVFLKLNIHVPQHLYNTELGTKLCQRIIPVHDEPLGSYPDFTFTLCAVDAF